MANFFHALWGGVGKITKIANDPFVASLIALAPGGGLANQIIHATVKIEATVTSPGFGDLKAQMFADDFDASLSVTQEVLAMQGKVMTYDKAQLDKARDSFVAGFNAIAAVKASFQIVELPKSAGAK